MYRGLAGCSAGGAGCAGTHVRVRARAQHTQTPRYGTLLHTGIDLVIHQATCSIMTVMTQDSDSLCKGTIGLLHNNLHYLHSPCSGEGFCFIQVVEALI